ncbi:MAG: tetratricopeptide repeat protein [Thermodesulfobacteriota bacterium]
MRKSFLIPVLIVLGVSAVYVQTLSFSFVGFDDPDLIVNNPRVRAGITGDGLAWAFGSAWRENVFFYPLAIVSHMADVSLFGLHAGAHHLSSLLFHAAAAVLLFFLLSALSGAAWRSGFVAGLFAVHPLTADSVAWVAERSNVLCALFWMATMLAYVRYCRAGRRKPAWYLFCLALFILALLAKPVAVTLPVVLLLTDWLVTKRFTGGDAGAGRAAFPWPVLAEKIPFFLLAGLRAMATIIVPVATGAAVPAADTPLSLRLANGLVSFPVYIRRLFAPYDLSVYYPFPSSVDPWKPAAALIVLAAVTAVLFRRLTRRPLSLFGWLWFLVALVPTLGLFQSGPWPAMADHFAYIPMIGLIMAVTWAVPETWTVPGARPAKVLAGIAVIALTAAATAGFYHTRHYSNSVALFERAVKVTRDNFFAFTGLGNACAEQGDLDRARSAFEAALKLRPASAGARHNLGMVLAARGETDQALACFAAALAVDPRFAPAHVSMGNLLLAGNRPEAAASHYRLALAEDPDLVPAHNNLALALASSGKTGEAVAYLQQLVLRFPHRPELQHTLERLMEEAGADK